MRILLVHNRYRQYGGEDAAVAMETRALRAGGNEVFEYTRDSAEIDNMSLAARGLIPVCAVRSNRTLDEVRGLVQRVSPDVAFVHNVYPLISPAVYTALAEAGIPAVQVAHNFRPFCLNGLLYRNGAPCELCMDGSSLHGVVNRCFRGSAPLSAMYALATSRARRSAIAGWIAMTPFAAGRLTAAGVSGDRIFIRPNFIAPGPCPANYGTGKHALFLGRLSTEKGINTLLDAFTQTRVPLVIAGAGPAEPVVRRTIADRRLTHITVAGFVEGETKRRLIEDAEFLVFPSECYENFAMVLLEAFKAGKPIIASNIGSLPHIVRHRETGMLFSSSNVAELAHSVDELHADPALRSALGRAARRAVESEYTERRWLERTMEICHAVTGSCIASEVAQS